MLVRTVTSAAVSLGLAAGAIATTGSALPPSEPESRTASYATGRAAVSAPLAVITQTAQTTLADARSAVADARDVTADIQASGLSVSADTTVVNTSVLSDYIGKLDSLDVTPAMLVPSLAEDAQNEVQSVREDTAMLRGQLDAAVAVEAEKQAKAFTKAVAKVEKKAKAKAKAEAAAKAKAKAEAEAKAKAEAEAAAAESSASSESGSAASSAPAVNVNVDPASAQGIARSMMADKYGWGDDQFSCLVSLWNKESGWRVDAYNAGSGAYGIPQALPGSKMASAGSDWKTNPATQIAWGLGYISGRYGNACGAWNHSQSVGWY